MWIDTLIQNRKRTLMLFGLWAIISIYGILNLKFSFSFEQFFPKGDPDLEFFNLFIEEFETDDNFLLLAIEAEQDVFDTSFLNKIDDLTLQIKQLPYITSVQSITDLSLPDFTSFPFKKTPLLNRINNQVLQKQKEGFLADERFVYNIINKSGTSTLINIKTEDNIQIIQSIELMEQLKRLLQINQVETHQILGRAYFQDELSKMQKREVLVSSLVSVILVCIVCFLIYRQWIGVFITLISIGLGLLIFMGILGLTGRPLNAMSAFYPVLMLIVGTSDIIHIMTKYLDELKIGKNQAESINVTIRQIGLATLLTSLTTSAGFLSLVASKVEPIRDFGINSALGVMVAYVTVIFFSTALLSFFRTDQLIKENVGTNFLDRLTVRLYTLSKSHKKIAIGSLIFILFSSVGISNITTNYKIESNLPRGEKITEDFFYFEEEYGGFRPFEFAIMTQNHLDADDRSVMIEVEKLESMLRNSGYIKTMISPVAIFKSINQLMTINKEYTLPTDSLNYAQIKTLTRNIEIPGLAVLFNEPRDKTRLSCRINDKGAEVIKSFGEKVDRWIENNIDASIVEIRRTGTGLLLDKNAMYIRDSLLYGLGFALLLVSLLMGLLFKNIKMVLVSLVPNILPLIFAAAILGWAGIELEAGISIVFAIVFGIAVDDTIHFLSKYKLCRLKGMDREESIATTFNETGKAIIITSIILFFGFLIMLASVHPPSIIIGLLISITLVSAIVADLLLLPMLLRRFDL